jgi:hypothetical protein
MINKNNQTASEDFVKSITLKFRINIPHESINLKKNNDTSTLDKLDDVGLDLAVVSKQDNYESVGNEGHILQSDPKPSNRPTTRKRKSDQLIDSPNIDEENTSS